MSTNVLLVECSDCPGLVYGITGVLFRRGLNIVGNQEFVDTGAERFFMRTEFVGATDAGGLLAEVRAVLPADAVVRLSDLAPKRIVILASREHHCLADLLVRQEFGVLNARLLAVAANHAALGPLVEECRPDFIVLAKFMRVLSPDFVRRFPSRIINIHHSFLPAFAGAKPYHQAFQRGVKVIGATAHFVTDQLDEGPIIVQQVIPVDHTHTPEDLSQAGHDVEQIVLARALKLVFEDRVLLCGNRTVIFD
jgi:formyltetrahydrofolate deformylase